MKEIDIDNSQFRKIQEIEYSILMNTFIPIIFFNLHFLFRIIKYNIIGDKLM
ncbi:unnamed protein product [Paramecium sonneborni]|uniref:Uncharacterized protein n=1 Tax=Paramecium sonneborni TaxID=65129 RepID=A0A8S1R680_9CILI|nr:unnamed protein product [Paramecium sonneborni]